MAKELASDTLQAMDQALDAIEDKLDVIENVAEKVVTVSKNNPLVVAGAFVLGAAIGSLVAYRFAVKRTETKYESIMVEQMQEAKEFYKRLGKTDEFETPESAAEALIPENVVESIKTYQGARVPYNHPEQIAEVVVEEVVERTNIQVNVFEEQPEHQWDYNTEEYVRAENPGVPYVVHFDEFIENEPSNEQNTLVYFLGDDTLVDERDNPIDNVEYTIGMENLKRFGHGSHDSKVVYIRNPRMGADFEVNLSTGFYSHEVLGMDAPDTNELKHSQRHPNRIVNRSTPRKFRGSDE